MPQPFRERRRTPRVEMNRRFELRLGRRVRVRVVDISGSGALLAADERLPAGSGGRLQVLLGGEQFEAQVEIRREQAGASQGVLLGSTFTPGPRHEEALEAFLRRAWN